MMIKEVSNKLKIDLKKRPQKFKVTKNISKLCKEYENLN